jgi:type IV pilus assembly protein PilA
LKTINQRKGFTLIELMIVVAIIGILAAIAIPNFLRFQLKAKSSEGKTNLAAIRTAEQSYYSEFGFYVSAAASPTANAQNLKATFTNADGAGDGFDQLGWAPEGQVFFNYGVATDNLGSAYTASAGADIDADATSQLWGYKKGPAAAVPDAVDLNPGVCPKANLMVEVVGPCDNNSGQSVF